MLGLLNNISEFFKICSPMIDGPPQIKRFYLMSLKRGSATRLQETRTRNVHCFDPSWKAPPPTTPSQWILREAGVPVQYCLPVKLTNAYKTLFSGIQTFLAPWRSETCWLGGQEEQPESAASLSTFPPWRPRTTSSREESAPDETTSGMCLKGAVSLLLK